MGQYYNVLIERDGKATAYDRTVNGEYTMAKLTEHSWWENTFTSTITNLLWKDPAKVAWVGDYAEDEEKSIKENLYKRAWSDDARGIEKCELYLDGKFLVNHAQKIYLDCNSYKKKKHRRRRMGITPTATLNSHWKRKRRRRLLWVE